MSEFKNFEGLEKLKRKERSEQKLDPTVAELLVACRELILAVESQPELAKSTSAALSRARAATHQVELRLGAGLWFQRRTGGHSKASD